MKGFWTPLAILGAVLAFALWNGANMSADTARWRDQLRQADALAQSENWAEAAALLAESYRDWSGRQTYLHIVSAHEAVDDAEAMYRRCLAFAAAGELPEFRSEIADLRDQLRLLAEMERLDIKNIL